jgi:hypothetical protein
LINFYREVNEFLKANSISPEKGGLVAAFFIGGAGETPVLPKN